MEDIEAALVDKGRSVALGGGETSRATDSSWIDEASFKASHQRRGCSRLIVKVRHVFILPLLSSKHLTLKQQQH